MKELILFLMTFVFTFVIYELFLIGPAKKRAKNEKKGDKELVEIKYLEKKYKLNLKKVNYNQLLQIVALVSSFDISLVVTIILLFDNLLLEVLVGFISTLIIILLSYHLVYLFYKKKGMINNE